jgi:TetR/AcrR family transcriptional regulator, repressor of fatR-cypB operon
MKTTNTKTDKRASILQAALELFAERGFHGTAVPLVAERAGVAAGTIYRYFENKEALVNELYQHWKRRMIEEIMTDFPQQTSAREQFHFFWQKIVHFAQENPCAMKFLELQHHAPYLDDASRHIEECSFQTALAFLENGKEKQSIRSCPSTLLMAITWGSFVGLIRASWEGKLSLEPETVNQAEQCAWEAIRN